MTLVGRGVGLGFAWADDEVLAVVVVDARERLARRLYADLCRYNGRDATWDEEPDDYQSHWRSRADQLLAVIGGMHTAEFERVS